MHARLLLCLALSALASSTPAQEPTRPPSVVVFVADDLGWRDLGCFGSSFYETPHLDRLAGEGMRFTDAYAACQVCSPTRVSLMTGKTPARLDTTDYFGGRRKGKLLPAPYDDRMPLEEVTLAEALREAGYRTAFLGKWHLGPEGFWPTDQGFELNRGGFTAGHPPKGYFAPYGMPTLTDGPDGEHLTTRLADEALGWLDDLADDEPFLLYLSFYAVHTPLQTTDALKAKYEARRDARPEGDAPRFLPEGEREARQVQDHAVYAGMVESMDSAVGRVLARLDELGRADDTLVVFTSDNGGLSTSEGSPTSNVPLRAGKGWMYEGGIRVPLIVRWPGITAAGSVCRQPAITTDLYPTVLEALGLPPRPGQHVDGRSLAPLLRGGREPVHDALFWHYPHYGNQGDSPSGAIRQGDWKLIEHFEDGRVELFDLAHDLGEAHDLAAAEPERAARLLARLRAWREEVDAKLPTPAPREEER
jgi:arylsulfatase A-like enzyme